VNEQSPKKREVMPQTKDTGKSSRQERAKLKRRVKKPGGPRRTLARAAEKLRESEERFRSLSRASMEAVVIHDGKKVLDANRKAAAMFGYSLEELRGMNPLDLAAPESRKKVGENIRRGYRRTYEAVGLRKDGTKFPGKLRGKPLSYRGKPARVAAIRDVTAEKRYEEALRESENRYRTLFSSAAEGILVAEAETRKIFLANPAACRMFGHSRREFKGKGLLDLHPRDARNTVLSAFGKRAAGRKPIAYETPCRRGDGSIFFADVRFRRSIIDGRECLVGFYAEATKPRKAREKLLHLNKVLRAVRLVNQLITREKDRGRLIREACGSLIKTFGYGSAWTVLLDEAGKIGDFAQAGFSARAFRPMARLLKQNRLPECAKKALAEKKILVIRDPRSTCGDCPLREGYNGKGPMLIRLEHGKKVYGLLGVSIPLEFLSEREEMSLFREVAGDLSFAFHSIDLEEERRRAVERMREAGEFAENIVATVREPLLVLDEELRVVSANRSFYRTFKASRKETLGHRIYDLGEGKWNIPGLRELLEEILPLNTSFDDFEVHLAFPKIGEKTFLLNARRIHREKNATRMILLAIEDTTERKKSEEDRLDYETKLRLLASELARAEERERRRIAAIVHDEIGQRLALVKIRLDAFKDAGNLSPTQRQEIREIGRLLQETIRETRTLSFELSPPMMHELGIANSMRWLLDLYREKHGLRSKFRDDETHKPLSEDLHIVLFQAVRELLMNVVKHAGVQDVALSVRKAKGNIEIRVRDRGKGFDQTEIRPYSTRTGGFGLFHIKERLEEYGGSLVVRSRPGAGTSVILMAPLAP